MHIKKLVIKGLFGRFNYDFQFKEDTKIFMIHGPNGFGKTQVLNIINTICEKDFTHDSLDKLHSNSVIVTYSDDSTLSIIRSENEYKYTIFYEKIGSKKNEIKAKRIFSSRAERMLAHMMPWIKIEETGVFIDKNTKKGYHNIKALMKELSPDYAPYFEEELMDSMEEKYDTTLLPNIKTSFLNTRRLDLKIYNNDSRDSWKHRHPRRKEESEQQSPLDKLSNTIIELLKDSSNKYNKVSQELDTFFLENCSKQLKEKNISVDLNSIMKDIDKIANKATELHNAKIIDKKIQDDISPLDTKELINENGNLIPIFSVHINNLQKN